MVATSYLDLSRATSMCYVCNTRSTINHLAPSACSGLATNGHLTPSLQPLPRDAWDNNVLLLRAGSQSVMMNSQAGHRLRLFSCQSVTTVSDVVSVRVCTRIYLVCDKAPETFQEIDDDDDDDGVPFWILDFWGIGFIRTFHFIWCVFLLVWFGGGVDVGRAALNETANS